MSYEDFLASKAVVAPATPVPHRELARHLFPFQRACVEWALERGRAALFEECGLGKTAQQLEWAYHVSEADPDQRPVLILAPLAVAQQTVREGARWGVETRYARTAAEATGDVPVVVTNYERLAAFELERFSGVVLDESSILKSFMGATKRALVERCAVVPRRLACTATPAPNDHLELGNHAEFLGVMSSHEMIARWFINDTSSFGTYRLKGHAVEAFWDWVASWARCLAVPSDIGFDDAGYTLPALDTVTHVVDVDVLAERGDGLFRSPSLSATSVHAEKRRTVHARARRIAELVAAERDEQWVVWCETDYEADALVQAITALDAAPLEVRGSHSLERKEAAAEAFAAGSARVLVSKPSIFGWGLNWQHVARVAFVGAGFSYESFYQAVRRSWRFGQTRPVHVHVALAATERAVWDAMREKRLAHETMRGSMSAAMRRAQSASAPTARYAPTVPMRIPTWLNEERRLQ